MAILIQFFEFCLQSPVIRSFIEGLALKIAADFWFHPAVTNDGFKQSFSALMTKLAATTDPAQKQEVLREIQNLRAVATAPVVVQPRAAVSPPS